MDKCLFTIKDVSEMFGVNVAKINILRKKQLLRFMKLGSYKTTQAEIDEFLKNYSGKNVDELCES